MHPCKKPNCLAPCSSEFTVFFEGMPIFLALCICVQLNIWALVFRSCQTILKAWISNPIEWWFDCKKTHFDVTSECIWKQHHICPLCQWVNRVRMFRFNDSWEGQHSLWLCIARAWLSGELIDVESYKVIIWISPTFEVTEWFTISMIHLYLLAISTLYLPSLEVLLHIFHN